MAVVCLRLVVRMIDAWCGLRACVHLLFVCDTAVGNVVCCGSVGVYVHALSFVDVRAIFMWCACCMCVHVLCMCDDGVGRVVGDFVGVLGARGIASCGYHMSTMGARSL